MKGAKVRRRRITELVLDPLGSPYETDGEQNTWIVSAGSRSSDRKRLLARSR